MFDFSKQISKFHQDHVRLTNAQRSDMRRRRTTNYDRIVAGLDELRKPKIVDTIKQGGYRQKTMTQQPEADAESRYDIDMGVVFEEAAVVGPRSTKNWVKDALALKATSLKFPVEAKPKCVRVVYAEGYQCDFPVLRRRWTDVGWAYDLAAGDEWIATDPNAMNAWVDRQVAVKSPEVEGSYQLRRIIRLIKYFAKVHAHRRGVSFPGGLVATALAVECYSPQEGRDDLSLRETLRNLSCRSEYVPVLADGKQVSDAKDVSRIKRIIDEAVAMLPGLDGLDAAEADEEYARRAWRKVFRHSYFDEPVKIADEARTGLVLETKSALAPGAASDAGEEREGHLAQLYQFADRWLGAIRSVGKGVLDRFPIAFDHVSRPRWPLEDRIPITIRASLSNFRDGAAERALSSGDIVPQARWMRFATLWRAGRSSSCLSAAAPRPRAMGCRRFCRQTGLPSRVFVLE